jgi:hypothetical protein
MKITARGTGIGCYLIALVFVIAVFIGFLYLYWLFSSWLVDSVWMIPEPNAIIVKVVVFLFVAAIFSALSRIGNKES